MSFLKRCLIRSVYNVRFIQNNRTDILRNMRNPLDYLIDSNINLIKLLQSKKPLTEQDWKQAREELLQYDYVNEKNIDAAIENICMTLNPNAFVSYVQFLKDKNYEINLHIAGAYVAMFDSKKSLLTDSEKNEICAIYDYVRKKYPILDVESCERFMKGLCLTDRWEESIDLLDMIKMSSELSPGVLAVIIKAAFRRGRTDIGWKYMNFANRENTFIMSKVYYSYLEYCLSTFKDKREFEINLLKMFEFLKQSEIIINDLVLNHYLNALKDLGYTHTQTSINRSGRCLNCSHQLQAPVITKEEFDEMSKFFLKDVVVGANVYYNTTPVEMMEFMEFLKEAKPYDIVIDGLNIALAGRKEKDSGSEKVFRLSKAVEYFVNRNKKILLLGRKHMLKWKHMDYVRHNTKMFLVENSSSDDVQLLYATLYGGMETCFLSLDLMRKQKYQLPINVHRLFKKWQLSHQYKVHIESGQVKAPLKFESVPQNDESGWHIPYYSGQSEIAKDSYDATTNWICLRKENK